MAPPWSLWISPRCPEIGKRLLATRGHAVRDAAVNLRCLLVEDDPTTRHLLTGLASARGYEVTPVEDGTSADLLLEQQGFDLVLLDWMLPGTDGLSLCRRLRSRPQGELPLVMMLTSRQGARELREVLDAGADDYLAKPVDPAAFDVRLEIAERQVAERQRRRRAEREATRALAALRSSHDDLLSILDELRIGSAITDSHGKLNFLNRQGRALFGFGPDAIPHVSALDLFPLTSTDRARLQEIADLPAADRPALSTSIELVDGRRFWLEVEIKDDPRNPERKIVFFYDVSEVQDLRRLLDGRSAFHGLLGRSPAMEELFRRIRDVASVEATVLIEGETGTGKELVARAIHAASSRRDAPFVPANCAGFTESILGSELFGHRRGSFTGAIEDRKGLFETAHGGTLFLDEIGDVPMPVQASLLRVLQEREVVRVGESVPRPVDVRVIAATHHHLAEDAARGTFRPDLLYRIRVARIRVPPLRARREDIPLLAAAFLAEARAASGRPVREISDAALRCLREYPWPGNVRELKSAIDFAVIGCRSSVLQPEDLPEEIAAGVVPRSLPDEEPEPVGREAILEEIELARGNRSRAARRLGISRATLYRRLARLGDADA